MDNISEELKTIVRSENVLAEQLADSVQELMGFSVDSIANAREVILQIEERISQFKFAISVLDDELHSIPKRDLHSLLENYYYPALENAHNRLRHTTKY